MTSFKEFLLCSSCGEKVKNCYNCQSRAFVHGDNIRCEVVPKTYPDWNDKKPIGGYSNHFGKNCCNPSRVVSAYVYNQKIVSEIIEECLNPEPKEAEET